MGGSSNPKVVVVTGASSGVGRAVVRALAVRGARLGLIARNEEALKATAEEVCRAGSEALVLPLDVADAEAVEQAAAAVEARWGRIDVWVNNAMATVFGPVTETTAEEYRRVTEVTYLGYVHGTLAALRRMRPRDEGTIVQIGSALAYRSIPLQSAYCAAKAAVRGFTDSLRTELIHDGSRVRLSMLQLPAVNTPQAIRQRNKLPKQAQPMPPMFTPGVRRGPRRLGDRARAARDADRAADRAGRLGPKTRPSPAGPVPGAEGRRAPDGRRAERPARAGHPVRDAAR